MARAASGDTAARSGVARTLSSRGLAFSREHVRTPAVVDYVYEVAFSNEYSVAHGFYRFLLLGKDAWRC